MSEIIFKISVSQLYGHFFDVSLKIQNPNPEGQLLRLPAWIPGSYMIRDFAKNITEFEVLSENGEAVSFQKLDKSTWQLEPAEGAIECHYKVYAYDISVRTAYLDQLRGFVNGSSLCLEVVGQSEKPQTLIVEKPDFPETEAWQLATTLPMVKESENGFGEFVAEDYQHLIDCPLEMAELDCITFEVEGKPHELIISGAEGVDLERIAEDLQKICQIHCDLFGGFPADKYQFQTRVEPNGYGGLEHRDSTALLCSPEDLVYIGEPQGKTLKANYVKFLGLCSHEYFHTWNIKRMQPSAFRPFDLSQENYTDALWFFEGMTSYYDDLSLIRSGLITESQYYDLISENMSRVNRATGQLKQSVTESSFEAWTKFYKQDENASNAIVSYYSKGAMIALMLDLKIRAATNHRSSLDNVMQAMWQRYLQGQAVDTGDVIQAVDDIAGQSVTDALLNALYQASALELSADFSTLGLQLNYRALNTVTDKGGQKAEPYLQSSLGVMVKPSAKGLTVMACLENQSAMNAGLSAKDEIIAINFEEATVAQLNALCQRLQTGDHLILHVFRRGRLIELLVKLNEAPKDMIQIDVLEANNAYRNQWLLLKPY